LDKYDLIGEGSLYVIQRQISKPFWDEALVYVCYLINKLPSSMIGGPLEVWTEKLLKTMTHYGYLVVQPITILRKTSWVRERGKVCSLVSRKA